KTFQPIRIASSKPTIMTMMIMRLVVLGLRVLRVVMRIPRSKVSGSGAIRPRADRYRIVGLLASASLLESHRRRVDLGTSSTFRFSRRVIRKEPDQCCSVAPRSRAIRHQALHKVLLCRTSARHVPESQPI